MPVVRGLSEPGVGFSESGLSGAEGLAVPIQCGVWRDPLSNSACPGFGVGTNEGTEKLEALIIDRTLRRKPADGSTHLEQPQAGARARHLPYAWGQGMGQRELQPNRCGHYAASHDRQFEKTRAEIIDPT